MMPAEFPGATVAPFERFPTTKPDPLSTPLPDTVTGPMTLPVGIVSVVPEAVSNEAAASAAISLTESVRSKTVASSICPFQYLPGQTKFAPMVSGFVFAVLATEMAVVPSKTPLT